MQAVPALLLAGSSAVAAVSSTAIAYTTPRITGLAASTQYSYAVLRGDGTAVVNCADLGTTDASGVLTSQTVPSPGLTYATTNANPYTTVVTVYTQASCTAAAPTATSVAVGRGTVSLRVSINLIENA